MSDLKVHFMAPGYSGPVCNVSATRDWLVTLDMEKVTCGTCQRVFSGMPVINITPLNKLTPQQLAEVAKFVNEREGALV